MGEQRELQVRCEPWDGAAGGGVSDVKWFVGERFARELVPVKRACANVGESELEQMAVRFLYVEFVRFHMKVGETGVGPAESPAPITVPSTSAAVLLRAAYIQPTTPNTVSESYLSFIIPQLQ